MLEVLARLVVESSKASVSELVGRELNASCDDGLKLSGFSAIDSLRATISGVVPRAKRGESLMIGDFCRVGLGSSLVSGAGLFDGSLDRVMPGNCMLLDGSGSDTSSTWVLRNAADPAALSCVWRNHVGSLLDKDAAISFLVNSVFSSVSSGSLDMLRTVATPERGRCLAPSLLAGRCCHDKVPLLARPEAVGGASSVLEEIETGRLCESSNSLTGDVRPLTAFALESGLDCGLKPTGGLSTCSDEGAESKVLVDRDSGLAGPVFDGDIDLARSATNVRTQSKSSDRTRMEIVLTQTSCLSFLPAL